MEKFSDQEIRLKSIFETVYDGIITIDSQGIVEGFNPASEKLFGYAQDEVVGKNIKLLMAEPHKSKHDDYLKSYLETGENKVIGIGRSVLGRRKDGSVFPFELAVTEMKIDGKIMFTGVVRDVTKQESYRQLLEAITTAQQEISRNVSSKIIFDKLLSELLNLTQSEYGFIGEISYDRSNKPILTTHSITNIAWNAETQQFYEENAPEGLVFTNTETLFGAVMLSGNPVISNDPANDPRSGGLPEGHPDLNAFLGLPFYSREEFVGMVGVANRPGGYSEDLVEFLQPFLTTCSNLIITLRSEKKRKEVENTLRENEARGRAILTGATEAIVTINEHGLIEDANPATETVFGYSLNEILGQNVKMLMPTPYKEEHDNYIQNYVNTGIKKIIGQSREVTGLRKNGETFPMFLSVNHITVGGRNMFTGVIRDISEQKRNDEKLKKLNEDLSVRVSELDALNEVNFTLNQMNSYLQTAENETELFDILAKFSEELFPNEVGAYFGLEKSKTMEIYVSWGGDYKADEEFGVNDCWAMRKGEVKTLEPGENHLVCNHLQNLELNDAICQPVSNRSGTIGLLSLYTPKNNRGTPEHTKERMKHNRRTLEAIGDRLGIAVSSLKLREELRKESIRDPLTKLFNRRFLSETLELEARRFKRNGLPISIILIDADYFKVFNDSYGHDAGDLILQKIAEVLGENSRKEDLACRYGGEEFALVCIGLSKEDALSKAEKIRKSVEELEIFYEGVKLSQLTISIGIATLPDDGGNPSSLLRQADQALYRAKENGRNRVELAGSLG